MKKLSLIAALMLGTSTAAMADASIFAAHGCDTANIVPVVSESNPDVVLYWANINGGGCKADRGNMGLGRNAPVPEEEEEVVEEEPTDPVDEPVAVASN